MEGVYAHSREFELVQIFLSLFLNHSFVLRKQTERHLILFNSNKYLHDEMRAHFLVTREEETTIAEVYWKRMQKVSFCSFTSFHIFTWTLEPIVLVDGQRSMVIGYRECESF